MLCSCLLRRNVTRHSVWVTRRYCYRLVHHSTTTKWVLKLKDVHNSILLWNSIYFLISHVRFPRRVTQGNLGKKPAVEKRFYMAQEILGSSRHNISRTLLVKCRILLRHVAADYRWCNSVQRGQGSGGHLHAEFLLQQQLLEATSQAPLVAVRKFGLTFHLISFRPIYSRGSLSEFPTLSCSLPLYYANSFFSVLPFSTSTSLFIFLLTGTFYTWSKCVYSYSFQYVCLCLCVCVYVYFMEVHQMSLIFLLDISLSLLKAFLFCTLFCVTTGI